MAYSWLGIFESVTFETIADGQLQTGDDGTAVIRFERRLAHPIERVWAALTEPEQMIKWWGRGDIDLVEGGRFTVTWQNTDDEGNRAVMESTIKRLDPPRLLETTGGIHGDLRWELEPAGNATILRFSSTLELPEQYRTMTIAGWHWHLDALATILDGGGVDTVEVTGWEPIHERYVGRYG
jgi:uncharacterized protein YndB with AHSA1/START domain